jgi:predicted amidohydrolase
MPLRVAASQFPVSGNNDRNAKYIHAQMELAAINDTDVVLFPESALPGYGPKHIGRLDDYPWDYLAQHTQSICELARSTGLWVVFGSMRKGNQTLPLNCLHVISNFGEIVGTYDKRRLYKNEKDFYSPGQDQLVVEISGYKCGFLICYDNCFQELYDKYRNAGVGLLFHSFFNAGNSHASKIEDLMSANLIVRAADNQMSIVASNSSSRNSPLSARVVRPDGHNTLAKRHVTSLVYDDYPAPDLGWTYDNRIYT